MRVTETLFSVTLKFLCQAVTQMFTDMRGRRHIVTR